MIIKFVGLALTLLMVIHSYPQVVKPRPAFGLNLVFSKPIGNFSNEVNFGAGAAVFGGIAWEKTSLFATTGYRVLSDGWCLCNNLLEYVPVKVGVKQFVSAKTMYVQGDLGIASVKSGGVVQSSFAADIGVGLQLSKFQLGLFYETFTRRIYYEQNSSNANSFNAKIGFDFSVKHGK